MDDRSKIGTTAQGGTIGPSNARAERAGGGRAKVGISSSSSSSSSPPYQATTYVGPFLKVIVMVIVTGSRGRDFQRRVLGVEPATAVGSIRAEQLSPVASPWRREKYGLTVPEGRFRHNEPAHGQATGSLSRSGFPA